MRGDVKKAAFVFLFLILAASFGFAQHSPKGPSPTAPPPAPAPTAPPPAPPPPAPAPAPAPTTPSGPATPTGPSIPSGATHDEEGSLPAGETMETKSKLQKELEAVEKEEAHAWKEYKARVEEKGQHQGQREEFCKSWRRSHERAVEASDRYQKALGTPDEPVLKKERDICFNDRDAAEVRLRKIQENLDRLQNQTAEALKKYEQAMAKNRLLRQEIFDATNFEPRR